MSRRSTPKMGNKEASGELDCLVCIDFPPNKAIVILGDEDGNIPVCRLCFDAISNNLSTDMIRNLKSL